MHMAMRNARGAALGAVLGILGAVAVTAALTYFFYCPCSRVPGGWLLGNEVTEAVAGLVLCQRSAALPDPGSVVVATFRQPELHVVARATVPQLRAL